MQNVACWHVPTVPRSWCWAPLYHSDHVHQHRWMSRVASVCHSHVSTLPKQKCHCWSDIFWSWSLPWMQVLQVYVWLWLFGRPLSQNFREICQIIEILPKVYFQNEGKGNELKLQLFIISNLIKSCKIYTFLSHYILYNIYIIRYSMNDVTTITPEVWRIMRWRGIDDGSAVTHFLRWLLGSTMTSKTKCPYVEDVIRMNFCLHCRNCTDSIIGRLKFCLRLKLQNLILLQNFILLQNLSHLA